MDMKHLICLSLLSFAFFTGYVHAQGFEAGPPIEEDCAIEIGTVEGDIRYNSGADNYEYFNGCEWQEWANNSGLGVTLCLLPIPSALQYNTTSDLYEFCSASTTWTSFYKSAVAGAACSKEGELSYNTTDNRYELCNGTNYYPIRCEVEADCIP